MTQNSVQHSTNYNSKLKKSKNKKLKWRQSKLISEMGLEPIENLQKEFYDLEKAEKDERSTQIRSCLKSESSLKSISKKSIEAPKRQVKVRRSQQLKIKEKHLQKLFKSEKKLIKFGSLKDGELKYSYAEMKQQAQHGCCKLI